MTILDNVIRIEGKWIFRLELFDILNNIPVACQISKKESSKIIYDFINISLPLKDRKAIITDLKQEYDEIIKNLIFQHQHCIFHLIKNILTNLKPKISEELNKYEEKLRKNNPKFSKNIIKQMLKEKKEEINDEIKECLELFYELFHHQSFEKAINYIKLLKYELKIFLKYCKII